MTKLVPAGYGEQDAKAHFEARFDHALNAPLVLLRMTATLKRRALKKKLGKPDKKAGKGGAIPAVLSFARPE